MSNKIIEYIKDIDRINKDTPKTVAEYFSKLKEIPFEYFEICDDCHQKETSEKFFSKIFNTRTNFVSYKDLGA